MSDEREELDALAERVPSAEMLAQVAMSPREWALAEQRDAARERYTKLRQAVEGLVAENEAQRTTCPHCDDVVGEYAVSDLKVILREHPPLE